MRSLLSSVRAVLVMFLLLTCPLTVATVMATTVAAAADPGSAVDTAVDTSAGAWPLRPQPQVVRGFAPPEVRWGAGHRGVDLAGHVGQPVHAALAGTVTFAGRIAGRGVVVVDHGTFRTTYEPVAASVSRGQEVDRGQVLGSLSWFGSHCAPATCLHWGLIAGETYLDPLRLVGGPRPVRLLPLVAGPGVPVTGAPSAVSQPDGTYTFAGRGGLTAAATLAAP